MKRAYDALPQAIVKQANWSLFEEFGKTITCSSMFGFIASFQVIRIDKCFICCAEVSLLKWKALIKELIKNIIKKRA